MTMGNAPGTGLRGARTARGWSQSEAATELVALGRERSIPVAAAASLKTLLSRWENGHARPEPHYQSLLALLYDSSPEALGIGDASQREAAGSAAKRLRAAVAAAREPGGDAWQAQMEAATRLDARFGEAGAGTLVHALVEQLDARLLHSLTHATREAAAHLLAEAALLAAVQALDRGEPDVAWRRGAQARAAAELAERPVVAAAALAGMAAALVEAGDAAAAVVLLDHVPDAGPPAARSRVAAALGHARAALGDGAAADAAFSAAYSAIDLPGTTVRVDVARPAALSLELADLHRRHGHALVTLREPGAERPLRDALDAGPRTERHRASLHADLAVALAAERPVEAAEHARSARSIALRIGSVRIPARLAGAS